MDSVLRPPPPFCFENNLSSVTSGNLSRQWTKWKKSFEIYSKACELENKTDDVQVSILLHVIGEQCRDVYEQFTVKITTVKVLLEQFDNYFLPTKNLTIERHKFFSRAQQESESVEQYTFELNKLAMTCEFKDLKDDLIRDRLICGLREDALRERLLRESATLTLQKAIDICRIAEMSRMQAGHIKQEVSGEQTAYEVIAKEDNQQLCDIHWLRRSATDRGEPSRECRCNARAPPPSGRAPLPARAPLSGPGAAMTSSRKNSQSRVNNNRRQCDYCGNIHGKFKCPAYGQRCAKCHRSNHFAKVCRVYAVQGDSTDQTAKSRAPFLRRTKATAPPETTDTESVTESADNETTTNKYTRRGNSKFKSRKDLAGRKEVAKKNEIENGTRRPSLSAGAVRSERPRNFVRRRLGGANATSSTTPPSSQSPSSLPSPTSTVAATSRRPFRIASRRRPSVVSSTSTTPGTSTTQASTASLASEESLQDIGDTDSIEDPTLAPRFVPKSTAKIQRRPLVSLKQESSDQNPSATNEEERKRQSKKYSSSINQNQLDELKKSKSQEDTTTFGSTTVEDNSAETAVAIAAHQLLAAPIPNLPNYDEEPQPAKKSTSQTVADYSYTPQYTDFTEPKTIYSEEFSTPNYESTSLRNKDYISTTGVYEDTTSYAKTTFNPPKTTYSGSPVFLSTVTRGPLSTPSVLNQGVSGGQNLGPSTARYLGADKYVGVPVEDYGYSTSGYTGQEPSYFTREYLLESPVTKTYDDEYQYLSPVTTPQTTRKPVRKTIQRKISTTLPPTIPPATTPKPRRIPSRKFQKPFEKIQKDLPNRTYRPIDNYDYYDDGSERVAEKYAEGTKVVLHGKGTIECMDIGNFPHPASCKKFISCARIENGSLLGWEYICPKGLSFDPVGGICNWSAGLGCDEKDI